MNRTDDAYERELRALDARLHPDRSAEQAAKAMRADAVFVLSAVIVGLALVVQGLFFSDVTAQIRLRFIGPTTPAASGQNPISSPRHADSVWAAAGVEGGIPTRLTRCGSVIAAYTGTATTINNAISACTSGQFVELGAGTFTLSNGITFHTSNVTLRGQGADSTKLVFTGDVSGCGYFVGAGISMCRSTNLFGDGNFFDRSTTWTAGYTVGTTVITLTSVTGLQAGSTIFLDQLDDSVDGYPAAGDLLVCTDSFPCTNQSGGGNGTRGKSAGTPHSQTVIERVVSVSGNQVTIDPPLYMPNWRSAKTPGAWWNDFSSDAWLHDSGVEDLSIDFSANGSGSAGIAMHGTYDCWVKGVRLMSLDTSTGSQHFHVLMINGFRDTIRDSYLYGPSTPTQAIERYAMATIVVSQSLFENNFFDHTTSGFVPNGPTIGNVFAYNFIRDATMTAGGTVAHGYTAMNLHEGNDMSGLLWDIIHGPHFFETMYRNVFDRDANNPGPINVDTPLSLQSHSRFFNVVGNVLGDGSATSYQTLDADCGGCIYKLGWQGNDSAPGGLVANDGTRVRDTLFRWGNWDTETAAIRWCGTASNTGWANCSSTSEVPTAITNYPNTVPSTETIPSSLYRTSKPSFFGARTWPPIGPDVNCADGNCPTNAGLHAFKIPARICRENSMADDPAYGAFVRVFNRVTCYGA